MSSPTFPNDLGMTESWRHAMTWLRKPTVQVGVSEFKRQVARMVEDAGSQAVVIEKHGRPEAVLISYEAYQNLREALTPSLDALTANFDTALAQLQGVSGQAGMDAAFTTPPGEAGRRDLKKRFGGKR